jgi:hypothetical protein
MAKVYLVISKLEKNPGYPKIEFEQQVFPSVLDASNFTTARADQASAAGWDYEGFVLEVDEGTKKAKTE